MQTNVKSNWQQNINKVQFLTCMLVGQSLWTSLILPSSPWLVCEQLDPQVFLM